MNSVNNQVQQQQDEQVKTHDTDVKAESHGDTDVKVESHGDTDVKVESHVCVKKYNYLQEKCDELFHNNTNLGFIIFMCIVLISILLTFFIYIFLAYKHNITHNNLVINTFQFANTTFEFITTQNVDAK